MAASQPHRRSSGPSPWCPEPSVNTLSLQPSLGDVQSPQKKLGGSSGGGGTSTLGHRGMPTPTAKESVSWRP
eukprot:4912092-Pyramimonas_sp.AAC.1